LDVCKLLQIIGHSLLLEIANYGRQILTFCACAIFFLGVTCPSGFCAAEANYGMEEALNNNE